MRITKQMALEAAEKITAPLKAKIAQGEDKLSETVTSLLESRTPKDLKAVFAKYPSYFSTCGTEWVGSIQRRVTLKRRCVDMDVDYTQKEKDTLLKLHNDIQDANNAYKHKKAEIENTLIALSTLRRVQEQLPEAVPFLEVPTSTALILNVAPVRASIKKLTKQPCQK